MQRHFQEKSLKRGKRERTRSALIDGAISMIAEKGLQNVNIKDVTEVAGLAIGTFYNHFEDKEALLTASAYAVAGEIAEENREEMTEIQDATERVVAATSHFLTRAGQMPEWAPVLAEGIEYLPELRKSVQSFLKEDIELGIRQGKFDATVSQFLLDQVCALIVAALRTQLSEGAGEKITVMTCENILRLLGLAPGEARKVVQGRVN